MSEWYNHFATQSTGLWPRNDALIAKLRAANDAKVVELDAAIKDAEENLGESEIKDAQLAKAKHYDSIGDLVRGPPSIHARQSQRLTCAHCRPRRWSFTTMPLGWAKVGQWGSASTARWRKFDWPWSSRTAIWPPSRSLNATS